MNFWRKRIDRIAIYILYKKMNILYIREKYRTISESEIKRAEEKKNKKEEGFKFKSF